MQIKFEEVLDLIAHAFFKYPMLNSSMPYGECYPGIHYRTTILVPELILGIFQNGPTPPPNLKSGPELPHPISKVGQKVLKEKSHNR